MALRKRREDYELSYEYQGEEGYNTTSPFLNFLGNRITIAITTAVAVSSIAGFLYIKPREYDFNRLKEKNEKLTKQLANLESDNKSLKKVLNEKGNELEKTKNVPLPADYYKSGRVIPLFNGKVILTVDFDYINAYGNFHLDMQEPEDDIDLKVAYGKQKQFVYDGDTYNISVLKFSTDNIDKNIPVMKFMITKD